MEKQEQNLEVKKILSSISDAELKLVIEEIKCEDEDANIDTVEKYANVIEKISGEPDYIAIMIVTRLLLREAAYRWAALQTPITNE